MIEMNMNEVEPAQLEQIDGGIAPLVVGAYIILAGYAYVTGAAIGYVAGEWFGGS